MSPHHSLSVMCLSQDSKRVQSALACPGSDCTIRNTDTVRRRFFESCARAKPRFQSLRSDVIVTIVANLNKAHSCFMCCRRSSIVFQVWVMIALQVRLLYNLQKHGRECAS